MTTPPKEPREILKELVTPYVTNYNESRGRIDLALSSLETYYASKRLMNCCGRWHKLESGRWVNILENKGEIYLGGKLIKAQEEKG